MSSRAWSRVLSLLVLAGLAGCDSGGDGPGGSEGDGGSSPGVDGGSPGDDGGPGPMPEVDGGSGSGASGSGAAGGGSGGNGSSAGSGGDPGGMAAASLGKATFPDYSTEDNAAFLDGVVGTWEVAIFRVPEGMEDLIGTAELTIEKAGADGFAMQLVAENGELVSDVVSDGAINALLTPVVGQVFIYEESTIEGYLNVGVMPDGLITGAAGGGGEVAFRNDIVAYGREVPPVFAAIAGMYEGLSQALTCGQPPVIATVEAEGSVTLEGQYNLSCTEGSVSAAWDGNDDYVIPMPMGYELAIDKQKGGGSAPAGGITLRLTSVDSDAVITEASAAGPGADGNIASDSLIKEGELPTQQQFAKRKLEAMTIEVEASGDVEMTPWNMDNEELVIGDDGNLMFVGLTFTFQNAVPTEGTTDQVSFRFQTIFETFNVVSVTLSFKTDGSFVSGTFGGKGNGTLEPR